MLKFLPDSSACISLFNTFNKAIGLKADLKAPVK